MVLHFPVTLASTTTLGELRAWVRQQPDVERLKLSVEIMAYLRGGPSGHRPDETDHQGGPGALPAA